MRETGRKGGLISAVACPPFVFLKNYIIKRGFKDGSVGLIVSLLSSFYVFLKYAKLWELERAQPQRDSRVEDAIE
jgi:hypothetical protein